MTRLKYPRSVQNNVILSGIRIDFHPRDLSWHVPSGTSCDATTASSKWHSNGGDCDQLRAKRIRATFNIFSLEGGIFRDSVRCWPGGRITRYDAKDPLAIKFD